MGETIRDILLVLGRVATILPLLLFTALFMGRRAIGEMPVFDFLIIITLGSVVGADIADPDINHLYTAVSILAIGIIQRLVAHWKIKHRKFGKLITYEPVVVVQNGKFIYKNLAKTRYTVDDVLQMLRGKDVFNLDEVEVAILEENGKISVIKKSRYQNATKEDTGTIPETSNLVYPVIVEGKIYHHVLDHFKVTAKWLEEELSSRGVQNKNDVLFASIDRNLNLHISLKEDSQTVTPFFN
ncbi:MAG: DUF421 domain-containing protein [Bacillaceae bacterium]|nr:DUF421 domain-containing protein [Bacillaceae bacterium]